MDKAPVPPTVLLVDGVNTDRASQMQVHRQMIKMLASIPDDVPVAVFLLGRRLSLIQNFTTDPKLLKAALQKSSSVGADNGTEVEPVDDPNAMSALLEDTNFPAASLNQIEQFEREVYTTQMDTRIRITLDALRAIARHVAGYPGRKNLLWISSSFPIAINPDVDLGFAGIKPECCIFKKTTIQIPLLTASAANASGFLLASSSKTPRVQLVFLGNFGAEAFPIKASDNKKNTIQIP